MPLTCHSDQVETVTSGLYRASGNGEHEQLRMKFPQVELCSASADSVVRGGVEPPTFRFSGGRSYQLSYLTLAMKRKA
jgi:hypothetical protein